jgi:hypothetical protein
MYLSEWREFPSASCLAGKIIYDSSRLDVVEIARVPDMLPSWFPDRAKGVAAPRYKRCIYENSYVWFHVFYIATFYIFLWS